MTVCDVFHQRLPLLLGAACVSNWSQDAPPFAVTLQTYDISQQSIWHSSVQDEDLSLSLSQLVQHHRGAGIIASEVVSLLAMAPFVYIEVCTVIEFGPKRWLNVWNLIDLITYILQVSL